MWFQLFHHRTQQVHRVENGAPIEEETIGVRIIKQQTAARFLLASSTRSTTHKNNSQLFQRA